MTMTVPFEMEYETTDVQFKMGKGKISSILMDLNIEEHKSGFYCVGITIFDELKPESGVYFWYDFLPVLAKRFNIDLDSIYFELWNSGADFNWSK